MFTLFNLIAFQVCWVGLVVLKEQFIPYALIYLLVHLWLTRQQTAEWFVIVIIIALGSLVDTSLSWYRVFIFEPSSLFIPVWLVLLWACFATTLCHSLSFLSRSVIWQIAAGCIAPLSYLMGQRLGAVEFGYSQLNTFAVLALIWSAIFVAFFQIRRFFLLHL